MIMCGSCKEGTGGAIVTRREAYRLGMRTMGPPPAQHRANTGTGLGGGGEGSMTNAGKLPIIWGAPCPCSETTRGVPNAVDPASA